MERENGLRRINYRSDFDFILTLLDGTGGDVIGVPDFDWRAKFYTTPYSSFEASYIGGKFTNCFYDNGRIHVVCKNHRLPKGRLQVLFESLLSDEVYPDGIRREVTPAPLNIELVREAGDSYTHVEAEAVMPYIKGDKGEKGDKGDKGDKGEKGDSTVLEDSEDIVLFDNQMMVTEKAKRAVFDDLWISAGYVHNKQYSSIDRKNHPESPYILNGIPHTYEEALYTYNQSVVGYGGDLSGMYYQRSRLKTIFPIHFGALLGSKATNMFNGCSNIENIVLSTNYCNPSEISGMFSGCTKLRIVSGIIATSYLTWTTYINTTFQNCSSLEDFRIQNIKGSLDIHWSPKLSYETISYLVTSKTSTTVATITVHPDVYAKLTGDETSEAYNNLTDEKKAQWSALVETAAGKNITFATT